MFPGKARDYIVKCIAVATFMIQFVSSNIYFHLQQVLLKVL